MGNYYSSVGKPEYSSEELDSLLSSIPCKNKVIAEKVNFREIPDKQSRYQFISNGIVLKKNCEFISNFYIKLFKGNTLLFDSVNNPDFKYKPIIFDFDEKSHFSLNGVKHLPISLDTNNDIFIALLVIGNNDIVNDTDNFLLEIGYDSWENVNIDFSASLIRGMGYEFFQGKTVFRYSFLRDVIEKYCKYRLL